MQTFMYSRILFKVSFSIFLIHNESYHNRVSFTMSPYAKVVVIKAPLQGLCYMAFCELTAMKIIEISLLKK